MIAHTYVTNDVLERAARGWSILCCATTGLLWSACCCNWAEPWYIRVKR